jgi:PAS domain S-box-containing protein
VVSSTGPHPTADLEAPAASPVATDDGALPTPTELWEAVCGALVDFVVIVDERGKILYRNRSVAGFSPDNARPTLLDYVGQKDRADVPSVLQRVFHEGYHHYGEVTAPGPDGQPARYAARITPVQRAGVTIAAMVTAKDITEQKQTEALLRERERSLNDAQVIARVGSWSWDIDRDQLYWSPEMQRIFDTDGPDIANWEPLIFERVHPDDRESISEAFLQGLNGATTHGPTEFRIVHRDGTELWAVAKGSAEFDESGIPIRVFGTVQDISERKQLELQLEARIRRAAAVAELGQRALEEPDPRVLMDEAVSVIARALDVDFANVLELLPDEGLLRVLTAAGREGKAKALNTTVPLDSQAGYTLEANEPVLVEDLRNETRFSPSERLLASGVISHMTVVIHGPERPWGVLGAHSRSMREFMPLEAHFLRSVANILGSALARERAEKEVAAANDELEDFFDNATVGLQWLAEDGTILKANRAKMELLGYTHDEYVGHNITEFQVDKPAAEDFLRRLRAGEEIVNLEVRLRCKDGSIKHVLRTSSVLWRGDTFVHTRCFSRDITARKLAEEALRESEERFRRIAGNVQDIIFRFRMDPDAGIEYISPAAERISGHPLQEFYDDPDLTHRMTHPDDRGTLAKAFFDGTTEQTSVRWIRPDGRTVWVEYRNMPVRDDSGTLVAVEGVIRDITEIVLMQEALQQSREDLESRVEERFPSGNDYGLTFREMTVLQLVVSGRADKEIGKALGITTTTVHKHVASILDKMGASSRTEAGVRAIREGLVV